MIPLKPHPIYRSLTFWSGMLVMSFIAWTWMDSSKNGSYLTLGPATIFSIGSMAGIETRPVKESVQFGRWPIPGSVFSDTEIAAFPPPLFLRGAGGKIDFSVTPGMKAQQLFALIAITEPKEYRALIIPHWLIILLFTPIWSGLLLWRKRRQLRAMQAMPSET